MMSDTHIAFFSGESLTLKALHTIYIEEWK